MVCIIKLHIGGLLWVCNVCLVYICDFESRSRLLLRICIRVNIKEMLAPKLSPHPIPSKVKIIVLLQWKYRIRNYLWAAFVMVCENVDLTKELYMGHFEVQIYKKITHQPLFVKVDRVSWILIMKEANTIYGDFLIRNHQ